jgi:aromatic ring-opening dioxygenase LigB subunit
MSLVFAAIAPHGTLPEAPVENAEATHAALAELGRRFDAAAPEATIVLTPHNVHVQGHFAVVLAGDMAGSLEGMFEAPEVRLSCPVDLELARDVIVALHDDGLPVVGTSFGANDPAAATAPMDWGVLIPLWVMGGRSEPAVPVVVVSPARDRPPEEHVRAGRVLARLADRADRRIALIASADHGHAHDPDGPYGFHPAAEHYDRRFLELLKVEPLDFQPLVDLVDDAKADSLWQLLVLQGAIQGQAELLAYAVRSYYGMAVAIVA